MQIYNVVLGYYESICHNILISDKKMSQDKFQKLCDSFIEEASEIAVKKAINKGEIINHIGWNEIVTEIVNILIEREGFSTANVIEADYFGGTIIGFHDKKSDSMSEDVYKKIKQHNDTFSKSFDIGTDH